MHSRSKWWPGVVVVAVWIATVVAGGLLDQEGHHRASRLLAGAGIAAVGVAFLLTGKACRGRRLPTTQGGGRGGDCSRWGGNAQSDGSYFCCGSLEYLPRSSESRCFCLASVISGT
jgi:hypothetical protein